MFKNILIPVALDHEHDVAGTIETARNLLGKDGKITLLSVVEVLPGYVAEYVTVQPEIKILEKTDKRLAALAGSTPARELLRPAM